MLRYALLLLFLVLIGCLYDGGKSIDVVSATPASVTVFGRYNTPVIGSGRAISDAEMAALAQSHCARYSKDARRDTMTEYDIARTITYHCVEADTRARTTVLPSVLAGTERSFTVLVGSDSISRQKADRMARSHCAVFDLKARQASDTPEPGGTARISYDCVP